MLYILLYFLSLPSRSDEVTEMFLEGKKHLKPEGDFPYGVFGVNNEYATTGKGLTQQHFWNYLSLLSLGCMWNHLFPHELNKIGKNRGVN
jgi:hypothetical protein